MMIHFKRAGGFSGIRLSCDIDTTKLPPVERQLMESIKDLTITPSLKRSDSFSYAIRTNGTTAGLTMSADDLSTPEGTGYQKLIEVLDSIAQAEGHYG
jgi:hypothetical protein